jgi:hypothetical protein
VPAIAATGLAVGDPGRFERAGFAAFLFKPYETEGLVGVLARVAPQVESLRAIRARCAEQRFEQRALRLRLAETRSELEEQRLRLAVKYGKADARDAARVELALSAARKLGESLLGSPIDEAEIVSRPGDGAGEAFPWLVRIVGGGRLVFVAVSVDAKGRVTVARLER